MLYVARAGVVQLLDLRGRWPATEVAHDDFTAHRLAADPRGGVWVLDRGRGRLARLHGLPLPARPYQPYRSGTFRPCVDNRDPPRLDRCAQAVLALAGDASKIERIVSLIKDIAQQTNLLALNATIEAARAGEAGRGFAIVASEVKALASETAKATEEITGQISMVQSATGEVVEAIRIIRGTIAETNDVASAIAAAVEEQSATTKEIAANAQQAASGTGEVSRNIEGVNHAASQTGAASSQVLSSAGDLAKQADNLKAAVSQFFEKLRAA